MKPRQRVAACLAHEHFDRLPIKHLAVAEVDRQLMQWSGAKDYEALLDRLGHDFREIGPAYVGPDMGNLESEHGIISCVVWDAAAAGAGRGKPTPLREVASLADVARLRFASNDWYDYSTIAAQCRKHADYARIMGYCEMDFINGMSGLRGNEQVLIEMASREEVFLELAERKYRFVYEHLRRALEAAAGEIDIVHLGEDLGMQRNLLIAPELFVELFGDKYASIMALAHKHGAKTMMHSCGSVVKMIPTLIDLGLDILDVVQTNADGMELRGLKDRFGDRLALAGTMCVQKVLPLGLPRDVRAEVDKRREMFRDGGLILGPSHQLQADTPLENILEMYRAAGGLT